jgi:hypothetical protein
MRRIGTLLLAGGLVVTISSGAAADSPRDSVTVGGQHLAFGTGPQVVFAAISAYSGADGEGAGGSMTFAVKGEGNRPTHADVTCLIVSGNDAIATAVVARPKDLAGQLVVLEAVDDGGPGSTPPDAIRFSFEGAIFQVSESCWLPILPPVDVQRGNVEVNDAT